MSLLSSGIIRSENKYPGKRILRKMGYLSDQNGIMNRYLREKAGWSVHVQNTKRFILEAIEEAKPDAIVVYGSGWLIDFPLEEAHALCHNIELRDIHHPPQIIRKVRDFEGVVPVFWDVTGGMIGSVWNFVQEKKNGIINDLSGLEYKKPVRSTDAFCISLNVLNQLDILLVDFLKKYFDLNEKVCNDFRKFVQSSHLEILQNNSCLITDVEEIRKPFNTDVEERKNLIFAKLPHGKEVREWLWDFDSAGLYHEKSSTSMRVKAISF